MARLYLCILATCLIACKDDAKPKPNPPVEQARATAKAASEPIRAVSDARAPTSAVVDAHAAKPPTVAADWNKPSKQELLRILSRTEVQPTGECLYIGKVGSVRKAVRRMRKLAGGIAVHCEPPTGSPPTTYCDVSFTSNKPGESDEGGWQSALLFRLDDKRAVVPGSLECVESGGEPE